MKSKPKTKYKAAATLTIHGIPDMTENGRREVAAWLRKRATELVKHPETFAKTFRARYLYECSTDDRDAEALDNDTVA